jgi:glutamate synthase domain-containing protein 3
MSAGIYKCNGVLAYSLNLEKKLKRKKNAEIVEVCEGEVTEEFLQKLLDKHNNITKKEDSEIEDPLKYHWKNIITNETLHSIYPEFPDHLDKNNWIKI